MFRKVASSLGRLSAGVAGVQLGAAAVALSDKELSKKPEWYQNAVKSLEESLKRLSKYGYIESAVALHEAEEVLVKVADVHNTEIQWRVARILTEKAELTKCPVEKAHLLHEAKEHIKKALSVEPAKGSAGAHKWCAIILTKLGQIEKHDNSADVIKHLEKATSIDAKDPYSFHLLGVAQYLAKDYKSAIANFEKAESIKAHFSSANLYYLGEALHASGKKDEAIKHLKQSILTVPRNGADGKARSLSKNVLSKLGLKPEEYEVEDL